MSDYEELKHVWADGMGHFWQAARTQDSTSVTDCGTPVFVPFMVTAELLRLSTALSTCEQDAERLREAIVTVRDDLEGMANASVNSPSWMKACSRPCCPRVRPSGLDSQAAARPWRLCAQHCSGA